MRVVADFFRKFCKSRFKKRLDAFLTSRVSVRLFFSILLNAFFIVWNVGVSVIYDDLSLLAVAVYYFLLLLARYALFRVREFDSDASNAKRAAVFVGILLLILDFAMAAVIIYTLQTGKKKIYSSLTVIPQTFFALYCLLGALARIIGADGKKNPVKTSVDAITVAAAFFSVFNLVNYLTHVRRFDFLEAAPVFVGAAALVSVFVSGTFLVIKYRRK